MTSTTVLLLCTAAFAVGVSTSAMVLARRIDAMRASFAEAEQRHEKAVAAEAAITRLLRLAASDVRDTALTLLGHADRIRAPGCGEPSTHADAIAAETMQLLSLADDLQDHAVPDPCTRTLRSEDLNLGALVRDAVAAVTATLGPGSRHWRIPATLDSCTLRADRRALSQVLVRVLAHAARFSRHDDWIDLSLKNRREEIALTIADEGAGPSTQEGDPLPGQPASRGLGLGLSVARVLMEAHGGTLTLESAARVGTSVTLTFAQACAGQRRPLAA